jgi:hypothetical protein
VVGGHVFVLLVGLHLLSQFLCIQPHCLHPLEDAAVGWQLLSQVEAVRHRSSYSIEPLVLSNFLQGNPVFGGENEQSLNEIPRIRSDVRRNLVVAGQYLLEESMRIRIAEGQVATEHGEEDDSTAPQVHLQRIITLPCLHHLWRSVTRRTAESAQLIPVLVESAESEVDDLNLPVVVDEDIFGF